MNLYAIRSVLKTSVGMVVQICNHSAEAGGCQVLGQPGLHKETACSKNKTDNNNENQSVSTILRLSKILDKVLVAGNDHIKQVNPASARLHVFPLLSPGLYIDTRCTRVCVYDMKAESKLSSETKEANRRGGVTKGSWEGWGNMLHKMHAMDNEHIPGKILFKAWRAGSVKSSSCVTRIKTSI